VPAPHADHFRRLGYELLGVAGQGGMGVVYRARQVRLNRLVALKVLPQGEQAECWRQARFRVEAEAMARLQHPNIVQVYDFAGHRDLLYLVLEFVDGPTLSRLLPFPGATKAAGLASPRWVVVLLRVLAGAVDHADRRGVVHRDLKPSNVLMATGVGRGRWVPMVCDFGVARVLETVLGLTATGQSLGSPLYMAPEQAEGNARAAGPAADVYALEALGFTLLAGRPPFWAPNEKELAERVIREVPAPLSAWRQDMPAGLEGVIQRCLRKRPGERFDSAGALADALGRLLG
jgi:eukaryotic-like serine/threonine-protein kinase